MSRTSQKELQGYARAYLAGKLPEWKWLRSDAKLMEDIKNMAEKIRARGKRRGKTSWKRTFPKKEYHQRQDGKNCNYCYPDGRSYAYKEHGRITHQDTQNVGKLIDRLGQSPVGDELADSMLSAELNDLWEDIIVDEAS